jgi:hypothetical protein
MPFLSLNVLSGFSFVLANYYDVKNKILKTLFLVIFSDPTSQKRTILSRLHGRNQLTCLISKKMAVKKYCFNYSSFLRQKKQVKNEIARD